MKKIIKQWGDSFVIVLSPEDMKIYSLNVADIIDIEIVKEKNHKKGEK